MGRGGGGHGRNPTTPTHGHYELSPVLLTSRGQDGSPSNSMIDIYDLTEKSGAEKSTDYRGPAIGCMQYMIAASKLKLILLQSAILREIIIVELDTQVKISQKLLHHFCP